MAKERIIRKDLRHDAMREGVAHALAGGGSFLGENGKPILIIAALFAGILALGGWASAHAEKRTMAANAALGEAMRTLEGTITADTSKMPAAARRFAFPTEQERSAAALTRFQSVRTQYSDRKASLIATILEARTLGEQGKGEDGLKLLDAITKRVAGTPLEAPATQVRLALMLDLKQYDACLVMLTALDAKPPAGWNPGDAGLVQADVLEYQGKRDQAKAHLEKLYDYLNRLDPKPAALETVKSRLEQSYGVKK